MALYSLVFWSYGCCLLNGCKTHTFSSTINFRHSPTNKQKKPLNHNTYLKKIPTKELLVQTGKIQQNSMSLKRPSLLRFISSPKSWVILTTGKMFCSCFCVVQRLWKNLRKGYLAEGCMDSEHTTGPLYLFYNLMQQYFFCCRRVYPKKVKFLQYYVSACFI